MNNDLPWMPFNVTDWLLSVSVSTMTLAGVGAYVFLLSHQWRDESLPDDEEKLRRLARADGDEWQEMRDDLLELFPVDDDGRRRNQRCKIEREEAFDRYDRKQKRASKGGKASGEARRVKSTKTPTSNLSSTQVEPKLNLNEHTTLHNNTLQHTTLHNSTAEGAPLGNSTQFNLIAEKDRLQERYFTAPCDTEDKQAMREVFDQIHIAPPGKSGKRRLYGQAAFLREIAQFDLMQVVWAAHEYLERDKPANPEKYFVAMVRNDAGKYQKEMEEKEIAEDEKRKYARDVWKDENGVFWSIHSKHYKQLVAEGKVRNGEREAAQKTRVSRTVHQGGVAGFHTPGDVLRELSEVWSPPSDKEPDAVPADTDGHAE